MLENKSRTFVLKDVDFLQYKKYNMFIGGDDIEENGKT